MASTCPAAHAFVHLENTHQGLAVHQTLLRTPEGRLNGRRGRMALPVEPEVRGIAQERVLKKSGVV